MRKARFKEIIFPLRRNLGSLRSLQFRMRNKNNFLKPSYHHFLFFKQFSQIKKRSFVETAPRLRSASQLARLAVLVGGLREKSSPERRILKYSVAFAIDDIFATARMDRRFGDDIGCPAVLVGASYGFHIPSFPREM